MGNCCCSLSGSRAVSKAWLNGVPEDLVSLEKKNLKVVLLGMGDLDEAVLVMRDSFCGSDATAPEPVTDWVAGPDVRQQWQDPRRQKMTEWYMKFCFISAVQNGGLVLGARSTEVESNGRLMAVCVALPPEHTHVACLTPTSTALLRAVCAMGSAPPSDKLLKGCARRMQAASTAMRLGHRTHARGRHYYVWVMATAPMAQGKGCTRALLDVVGDIATRESLITYLEAAGEKNRAIYGHIGYTVAGEFEIRQGEDCMPEKIAAMVRLPIR
mmetsp:Transcript_2493/g.7154  ORF Transcript_2493/g.7154 Transcript_2493/m.7154 type:complete len:270 (-) Transcript_2493:101-910(-)